MNLIAIGTIYRFQMARTWRTLFRASFRRCSRPASILSYSDRPSVRASTKWAASATGPSSSPD